MKEYKYCRCCNIKNDINNDKCYSCGADLENKVYISNNFGSFIMALVTIVGVNILNALFNIEINTILCLITSVLFLVVFSIFFINAKSPVKRKNIIMHTFFVIKIFSFFKIGTSMNNLFYNQFNENEKKISKSIKENNFYFIRFMGRVMIYEGLMLLFNAKKLFACGWLLIIFGIIMISFVPFIISYYKGTSNK